MKTPTAVLISDIHYRLDTLPLADAALRQAVNKSNTLKIPLIIAGDMHDTKANMRGECVNAMIDCLDPFSRTFILVGNHDKINEKSESHSLNFLHYMDHEYENYRNVVDTPRFTNELSVNGKSVHFVPYQHDAEAVRTYLKTVDKGSCIIMHQGIQGANTGEYYQDKSAINTEDVAGFRVISGHYHARQTIKLPDGGQWDYIGNPYTLTYGEANDLPKGFQVLYSDGSLEFIPTNLRKHVIISISGDKEHVKFVAPKYQVGDLIWVKLTGAKEWLAKRTKQEVRDMIGVETFRLDLIPLETKSTKTTENVAFKQQPELLDSIIDGVSNVSNEQKDRVKKLWKTL